MDGKRFSRIFIQRTNLYLWIIFILLIVLATQNIYVAVPGFILFLVLLIYNFRSYYRRRTEITKYIENLTFNIDSATKETLLNFPMPLVMIELDGTIIWYNVSFRKIFEGEDLLERTISSFIEELKPSNILNDKSEISKEVVISGKNYNVFGNFVKNDKKADLSGYILLLYFVDNSELFYLKNKYDEEKIITGVIIIDNYDDLMQSMEDSKRPHMLAEIDKRIVEWMEFTGGIIKKYERDKYMFLFEKKFLKDLEEKKFEILDNVKGIQIGNKIPVTLSIGLGIGGDCLADNLMYATASIDIALGRGGDQVVIKDRESISFYGGKTRELEKRTKVKARVIAYALRELIDQAPFVIIMGHENGDIDSLGASIGLYRIIKNRNKDAHIVLEKTTTAIKNLYEKIINSQGYEDIFISKNKALEKIDEKTLLIVVDTHRPSFTECPELLEKTDQIVVIDHHRRGTEFISNAVLTYQETYASSASELVTEILQYFDDSLRLKPLEAEALYAGIVIDTKSFITKTGVRTFEAAAYLRRQGVDTITVKQLFQNDLDTYINRANIVKNAEIINECIAISYCPPNIDDAQLISAQAADELLSVSGVIAAFVLSNLEDGTSISGRSLGDLNVQVILEKLGGGGSITVAGAQLEGITVAETKELLKKAIIEYLESTSKE